MKFLETEMWHTATFNHDRTHRYTLERGWAPEDVPSNPLIVIGLNPSTADEREDDPTIRRCIGFAKREGCTGLVMLNLFSFRATDPKDLYATDIPNCGSNDDKIRETCEGNRVLCAWGTHGSYDNRAREVVEMLDGVASELVCFGVNKDGSPKHPLYLASGTPMVQYTPRDDGGDAKGGG